MELQTHTPTVTFGFTYAHIAQYVLSIVSLLRSIHNVRFYNIMLYAIGMITTISKVVVQYNCLQYNLILYCIHSILTLFSIVQISLV